MDIVYPLIFLVILLVLLFFLARQAMHLVKTTWSMINKQTPAKSPELAKYEELTKQNLSPAERDRKMLEFLKEQKAKNKPKPAAAKKPLPKSRSAIALRRLKRDAEQPWQQATSWLGGLPQLADGKWPVYSETYSGYYCLAQINLSDLPKGRWSDHLPSQGALIFFADIHEQGGTIVYEPEPETKAFLQPPNDLEILNTGERRLRRWPVEFLIIKDWPQRAIHDAEAYDSVDRSDQSVLGLSPDTVHIDLPDQKGGPSNMADQEQIKNKLAGSFEDYSSLGQNYREQLMVTHQLPAHGRKHLMFAHGDVFQNEDTEFAKHVLLLQVNSDQMISNFGDATAVQFWIKPDDLKAGNWSACTVSIA